MEKCGWHEVSGYVTPVLSATSFETMSYSETTSSAFQSVYFKHIKLLALPKVPQISCNRKLSSWILHYPIRESFLYLGCYSSFQQV